MVKISDWINDVTNLDMAPETILFIFLGIAVLSLVCLCTILFIGLKGKKEDGVSKTNNLENENVTQDEVEEIIENIKREDTKLNENILENSEKTTEEVINSNPIENNNQSLTKQEELPELKDESALSNSDTDNPYLKLIEDIEEGTQTDTIEEANTKQPLPQIFSSVYLEPREEARLENEPKQPSLQIEEEVIPIIDNELILPEEPDTTIRRETKNYENIFEEQNDKNELPNPFDNNLQTKSSGKIYSAEENPLPNELEIDTAKEVILTADMLRERLAKLQSTENKKEKNIDEAEELDNILKQVGLNNHESPELDNEEEIILGR